jgi:hypothetical protein
VERVAAVGVAFIEATPDGEGSEWVLTAVRTPTATTAEEETATWAESSEVEVDI